MGDIQRHGLARRAALTGAFVGLTGGGLLAAPGAAEAATGSGGGDWHDIKSYGAVGNGVHDDAEAIQTALDTAGPGGVVYVPRGWFAVSRPLVIPPAVTLLGSHGNRVTGNTYVTPVAGITATAGFAGAALLTMVDKEVGGYPLDNGGQRITNLCLEGGKLAAGAPPVDGIRATGRVHDVIIDTVSIQNLTGNGITGIGHTRQDGSSPKPFSWCVHNTIVNAARGNGFHFVGSTDTTLVNCQALGVQGDGFVLDGMPNSNLTSCRAEWSAANGFHVTGGWSKWQGSGGLVMTGCTTDRNSRNGVLIDATGNGPILITGLMLRRDGRNGYPGNGGGGYAGLATNGTTMPVVLSGVTCYPGVGDDGHGVNSPDFGVSLTASTFVSVDGGYLHAAIEGLHDGGGNTVLLRGYGIGTAVGTTNEPTRDVTNDWAMHVSYDAADRTAVDIANTRTNNNAPVIRYSASTHSDRFLTSAVTGETAGRFNVQANGLHEWGSGAAARDVTLSRSAANTLSLGTADLRIATAGRGLRVAEGGNAAKMGTVVLGPGGTAVVATTSITAASRVFLTINTPAGTPGAVHVAARTAGTSFTVTSTNTADRSTVAYLIVEPA
ncbi:glycosyl hydrolase family 28-related protein [Embleya sp. NPDC001921]